MAEKKLGTFMVQQCQSAATGRGKPYLRMKVYEKGGRLWPAMFWEGRDEYKSGSFLDVMAEESEYNGEKQLNILAARVVTGFDPLDFLPKSKEDTTALRKELEGYVAEVADLKLRALLIMVLQDKRWDRSPAATTMHHAYLGGLIVHVVGLCRLSYAVAALYPSLRRDLLVTASVVHDFGKLEELESATTIEYTDQGNLIGHISLGLLRVDKYMDELGFDGELRMTVRHLIVSHHGQASYGSPKPPQILEAQVFCNLDGIDANLGKMLASIEKAGASKEWTDKAGFNDNRLYLGRKK